MAYPAVAVANSILEFAQLRGQSVTPMKLQKLVYLANGLYLALYGEPLVKERIEAWRYGPVVESLYNKTRDYGAAEIPSFLEPSAYGLYNDDGVKFVSPEDSDARILLDDVCKVYGDLNGIQLSAITHDKNSPEGKPWYETWHNAGGKDIWGTDIPNPLMVEEFKKLLV